MGGGKELEVDDCSRTLRKHVIYLSILTQRQTKPYNIIPPLFFSSLFSNESFYQNLLFYLVPPYNLCRRALVR